MGLPFFQRMYSDLEVITPRAFGLLFRTEIGAKLQSDQQAGIERTFSLEDYKFDFQEVTSTSVLMFAGRRLELHAMGSSYCSSSLLAFLPDSKTLFAFGFCPVDLDVRRDDGSDIIKWHQSIEKWKFRCPSRIIGTEQCLIFTPYHLYHFGNELKTIQQSYLEAIAQGLSFAEFESSYHKGDFELSLANGKNTLFFVYQQLRKNARSKQSVDSPK